MNNPFDFFEEMYCINIDSRTDRWKLAQEEFEKLGIKDRVQRFSAIVNPDGRLGVIQSNLEIVRIAKRKKLNNVLVFEDDVMFLHENKPLETLEKAIKQINIGWQLFYLGANTHNKLVKMTPNLIYLKNAFAVHSMAYNKTVYDKFIDYASNVKQIRKNTDILDVWLASEVQTKNIALMVNPMLTTQRESYSDIEKRVVDQSYIVERFKNNIK